MEQVDDYVRRVLREHNQEADHLANLGAEGQRQITVVKGDSTENWMAVRRIWDVSNKIDERSGCGIVVKGLGRKQVDHNLKVAAPMTTCTVMAAETVGASILTGILDLMIG